MITVIKHANVLNAACTSFAAQDLVLQDDTILEIGHYEGPFDTEVDASGCYAIPGFVDIHTHGAVGVLYADVCDFQKALAWNCERGITTLLPTLSTKPISEMLPSIQNIKNQVGKHEGASVGGIHFEGPFISPHKRGAMPEPTTPCTVENFKILADAAGDLAKVMTLAPERENALDVIHAGLQRGIRMSLGHTMATCEEATAAIHAGARGATHCFNAMRPYEHRETGVLGAVLTNPDVTCEVICDLVHLAPETIQIIRACKGVDGMILVSDSGFMAGMPDGEYNVGGLYRVVRDGVSRNAAGAIAASCRSVADGARNLLKLGFTMEEVARVASLNPAKAVGLDGSIGSLAPGKKADILLCDSALGLKHVLKNGKLVK